MKVSNGTRFSHAMGALALATLIGCGSDDESARTTGLTMGQPAAPSASAAAASAARSSTDNEAPVIADVVIHPATPRPGERVTAVVTASDPDGDPVRLSYQWTRDGQLIPQTGSEILLKDVRRGSEIAVVVTASDGFESSSEMEGSVHVGNRPPVLRGVVFQPLGEVSRAHDVEASPRSYDPDGDDVEYHYSWRVNGSEVFSPSAVLSTRDFARGDQIVLTVVADDGADRSAPLTSEPITVVNAPPSITSDPSGFDGEQFSYRIEVDDPDGDRLLRYELVQGPSGMRLDESNGVVSWSPRSDQAGTHRVEIHVDDTKGGSDSQQFELSLDFAPAGSSPASPTP